ncbi:hypothetical protein IMZ48_31325 [Candidatus Bathyarchaeota archaeon]|nr:hypothetical protein [Candidatus Bathyarchaeota archaeon]
MTGIKATNASGKKIDLMNNEPAPPPRPTRRDDASVQTNHRAPPRMERNARHMVVVEDISRTLANTLPELQHTNSNESSPRSDPISPATPLFHEHVYRENYDQYPKPTSREPRHRYGDYDDRSHRSYRRSYREYVERAAAAVNGEPAAPPADRHQRPSNAQLGLPGPHGYMPTRSEVMNPPPLDYPQGSRDQDQFSHPARPCSYEDYKKMYAYEEGRAPPYPQSYEEAYSRRHHEVPPPPPPTAYPTDREQIPFSSPAEAHRYHREAPAPMPLSPTPPPAPAAERPRKRFPCRLREEYGCDKTFTTSGHASRHTKIHLDAKNIPCVFEGCDKHFTRSDNMKQHLETHNKKDKSRKAIADAKRNSREVHHERSMSMKSSRPPPPPIDTGRYVPQELVSPDGNFNLRGLNSPLMSSPPVRTLSEIRSTAANTNGELPSPQAAYGGEFRSPWEEAYHAEFRTPRAAPHGEFRGPQANTNGEHRSHRGDPRDELAGRRGLDDLAEAAHRVGANDPESRGWHHPKSK